MMWSRKGLEAWKPASVNVADTSETAVRTVLAMTLMPLESAAKQTADRKALASAVAQTGGMLVKKGLFERPNILR